MLYSPRRSPYLPFFLILFYWFWILVCKRCKICVFCDKGAIMSWTCGSCDWFWILVFKICKVNYLVPSLVTRVFAFSTREYLFSPLVGRPQRRPTTKYAKLLQPMLSVLLWTSRLQAILLVQSFQGIFIFTASRAPPVAPDYKIC